MASKQERCSGSLLTMEMHTYITEAISYRQNQIGVHLNPTRRQNSDNSLDLCEHSLLQLFWKRVELSSKAEYMYTSGHELNVSVPLSPIFIF